MGYPFDKEQYFEIYKEIISSIESRNIRVFIVRGKSYKGNGRFAKGWYFVNGILRPSSGKVRADLIFNRDDKNTIPRIDDCRVINHPDFDELCVDKLKTFFSFPDISPKTAAVHSFGSYRACIRGWGIRDDALVVLKKNFGTEGRGIFILPAREVMKSLYDDWSDILLQEFLDSSVGIPGIVRGLHDLRVTVINGMPINSFLRVPKQGSYLANVAQGGTGRSIPLARIPKAAIQLVTRINKEVEKYFPAIYAIDFVRTTSGYKLIELNSRPGVQHPDWSSSYKTFNRALIRMLVDAVLA